MLNLKRDKPELLPKKGKELILSGLDLIEFLRFILNRNLPVRFSSKGHSMSPFIKDGDQVTVYPKRITLKLGDVVAFIHPIYQKLAIHRIVKIHEGGYCLRGDNTKGSDGFVGEDNILGSIKKVERIGRRKRLGLGPERYIIAFISKGNVIFYLNRVVFELGKLTRRKFSR